MKIKKSLKSIGRTMLSIYSHIYACAKGARIGRGTLIFPGAKLQRSGGQISIGNNCKIRSGAIIAAHGGFVRLGDDCTVNPYSILYGHGGLTVGSGVRIAAHVVVIPANHGIAPDVPIFTQPLSLKGVSIGDDVWIGAGVKVLDGSVICQSCILAAGAVFTAVNTEPFGIYGGIPARKIGSRLALGKE